MRPFLGRAKCSRSEVVSHRLVDTSRLEGEPVPLGAEATLTTQSGTVSERIPPGTRDVVLALDNPSETLAQEVPAAGERKICEEDVFHELLAGLTEELGVVVGPAALVPQDGMAIS